MARTLGAIDEGTVKLQYLGDSRDAFKWDLLHWLCTESIPPFRRLAFIPLLTPDDPDPRDGRTPHHWFSCRPFVRSFLDSLRSDRATLATITTLGAADGSDRFEVTIPPGLRFLDSGLGRAGYWQGWDSSQLPNALAFLDPDNGFETRTRRGRKWLQHRELAGLIPALRPQGAAVVYQQRPRAPWDRVLGELAPKLGYANFAVAALEPNLAFIVLGEASAERRIVPAVESYARNHPTVRCRWLRGNGA
jgi:hypothetical protein